MTAATGTPSFAEPDDVEHWCPITPSKRQRHFLDLTDRREVFLGGAAGGGKSLGILMAASQYLSWPNYKAIIFRRTYTDLAQEDAIMDVAKQWWQHKPGIYWNEGQKKFIFPSGAVIRFAYMAHEAHKRRYQGTQYHFVAYDELTQFSEGQYTYLFSRQRKLRDVGIPIRMRATSNPGGDGHEWVKKRFITKEAEADLLAGKYKMSYTLDSGRVFVPSRLEDNPGLDIEDYRLSLSNLNDVERAQLEQGDWTVSIAGIFPPDAMRYYQHGGDHIYRAIDIDGSTLAAVAESECFRLMMIDPAGTARDRDREEKGKPPSYSAIVIVDMCMERGMAFLRHVERVRVEAPDLITLAKRVYREYQPVLVGCENTGLGLPIYQTMLREMPPGVVIPLEPASKKVKQLTERSDKLSRSVPLQQWYKQNRVFFPSQATNACPWWSDFRGELLHWRGLKDQTCDQIDALAYAIIYGMRYADEFEVAEIIDPASMPSIF